MGDMCIEYFVLKKSKDEISIAEADKHSDYFVFNNDVYEIDSDASHYRVVMATSEYSALTGDNKLILAFAFYDGGCCVIEALKDQVKKFESIFNENKHNLADDLKHLI